MDAEHRVAAVQVHGRLDCCLETFAHYEVRIGNTNSLASESAGSRYQANGMCGPDSGEGPR